MKPLRLTQPYAIILVGLPGSGKTFFGEKFAETFNAPFINAGLIAAHAANPEAAQAITDHFLTEITRTKSTFIIEGDASSRVRRTELIRELKRAGYHTLLLWVQVDEPTAEARSRRQAPPEEYVYRRRIFSPPHPTEQPLVISGKHTYASQAKVVLNYLARQGRRTETQLEAPERPVPKPSGGARITIK